MADKSLYQIRHKTTGLYSCGGSNPSFTSVGKVWKLTQLKAHLRMLQESRKRFDAYVDCELIVFTPSTEPAKVKLHDIIESLEEDMVVNKLKG